MVFEYSELNVKSEGKLAPYNRLQDIFFVNLVLIESVSYAKMLPLRYGDINAP